VVVRPDQHVAWVGTRICDGAAVLDEALRGFGPIEEALASSDQ
jgi:hypothetical protein